MVYLDGFGVFWGRGRKRMTGKREESKRVNDGGGG